MTPCGFILLAKEPGRTTFSTLSPLKNILGKKVKVGHAGTLDNKASGLVIAAIGPATRLLQNLESKDKVYSFKLHLGISTRTCQWGDEIEEELECSFSPQQIHEVLDNFRGLIHQVPPQFSAVKIDGRRASDRAILGHQVELKSREITIYSLEANEKNKKWQTGTEFTFRVHCSKGTYVRSLGRDIGKILGVPACVSEIHREKIGEFSLENAVKWDDENMLKSLIPPTEVVDWPILAISDEQWVFVEHGNRVPSIDKNHPNEKINVFLKLNEQIIAFGEWGSDGIIQPRVVFQ